MKNKFTSYAKLPVALGSIVGAVLLIAFIAVFWNSADSSAETSATTASSVFVSQVTTEPTTEATTELTTKAITQPETTARPTTATTKNSGQNSSGDKKAAATTKKQNVTQDPEAKVTVYITRTGEKYHYENPCGNGTYYPISLAEAKDRGYEPCEKCVLH